MTADPTDEFVGHKLRGRTDKQHCKTKKGLVLQGREVWAAFLPSSQPEEQERVTATLW